MVELRQPLGMVDSTLAARRRRAWLSMATAMAVCRCSRSETSRCNGGFTRSIKSVVVSPARYSGVRRVVTKKSRLVFKPAIAVVSSTRASLPAASRRVGACTMTLAIIGSNCVLISLPTSTPESKRAPPAVAGFHTNTGPGDGKKPLAGFSAYRRASMA